MQKAAEAAPSAEVSDLLSQFRFMRHTVIAEYKRELRLDSTGNDEFQDALTDDPDTVTHIGPQRADRDRYRFEMVINAAPGFLGVSVHPVSGLGPLTRTPRQVRYRFRASYGDNPAIARESTTSKHDVTPDSLKKVSRGPKRFIDIASMIAHPDFAKKKRLVITTTIFETVNTEHCKLLTAPSISIPKLAKGIDNLLELRPNVRITFPDGDYLVHEGFLKASCNHFRDALDGGFAEGIPKKRKLAELESGEEASAQHSEMAPDLAVHTPAAKSSSEPTEHLAETEIGDADNYDLANDSDYDSTLEDEDEPLRKRSSDGQDDGSSTAKQLHMRNFSVHTFRAFMAFLHTGCVTFNCLTTSDADEVPDKLKLNALSENVSPCSAKSLYRMADYYNVPDLRSKCKDAFADLLTPESALREMAKPFARLHEPIMIVVVDYVSAHWSEISVQRDFATNVETNMSHEESRDALMKILVNLGRKSGKP